MIQWGTGWLSELLSSGGAKAVLPGMKSTSPEWLLTFNLIQIKTTKNLVPQSC